MFTGIVQDVGRVQVLEPRGGDVQMVIEFDRIDPAGIRVGTESPPSLPSMAMHALSV